MSTPSRLAAPLLLAACAARNAPPAAVVDVSAHPGAEAHHADPAAHHAGDGHHATEPHAAEPHAGAHGHFADPARFVAAWNDPGRDAWQKPEEIVAALGIAPGATVVDLGAGTGYLLPPLSGAVGPAGTVIALDVEPAMITFLQDAATREGWSNVRTHLAAFDDPGLAPASVDAIVTLNVWHHIEGREAYAARVREALKPGGAFVIVDFLKEETEGFGPPLAMRLTADQVLAELRAGGLVAELVPETMPRHYVVRGRRPAGS